jgi:hypothetical protein
LKTTRIEIVRYSRRLVTDNREPSDEDDLLTIDLTPEPFEVDAGRLEPCREIAQPKPFILRLREFLARRQ